VPLNVLDAIGEEDAITYVAEYFGLASSGRPSYSGSRFETFADGGDENEPNRITAEDLIAVSMLSVHVPAQAALGILGDLSGDLENHLKRLPVDARFEDLTEEDFGKYLGDAGPAAGAWTLLRQPAARWGVGQTTASKILARKRPHLVPIYDSVVAHAVGLPNSADQWTRWNEAFRGAGGAAGIERLRRIRHAAGQGHLSLLRVLDIVIWMARRGPHEVDETVGDEN